MEVFDYLFQGFSVILKWKAISLLFLGVFFGNLVGVLPGLGPATGTVLLISFTFHLTPTEAVIMLAGIYYGAMYGGSTTSVLLNIPGESSSVMTAVEGYQLTLNGRPGPALGMCAISAFIAGTAAVIILMFSAPPLARFALSFGPPEEASMILMSLTLISALGCSPLKGLLMGAFGVVVATIGVSEMFAATRMYFGVPFLREGIGMVAAMIGLFALPEIFENLEKPTKDAIQKTKVKIKDLFPNRNDFRESLTAFPLGTIFGFFGGLLPGFGAAPTSFLTYAEQKRIARRPDLFGKGSMEALAAVEGSNNAASTGALVPMLSFGIPGSATTAVLIGAMMIHGLRPGPLLFANNPEVAWGLIASMYLGNVMLFILNFPLIGMWVSMMRFPLHIIITSIIAISVSGVYATENVITNVWVMLIFGVIGLIFKKLNFPPAPIILALVLTPTLEVSLVKALAMSQGSWSILVTSSPMSASFIGITILSVLFQLSFFNRLYSVFKYCKNSCDRFFQ